ncbi:predicted protein [Plenodomus lingam JN3]|uniref:Predicted protein n=1 Tax=Leptosphaeria maculans (strain JN3 / isolate v23.1.3 / race Av1-4-5-6-7-8) TaxID=985895 RepID=E5A867_LEPMJ|nr:predicted protein [Plenodomus lingam JN3]CBX99812.1 predicted protein [Plenodomus lingam JN3]
MLQFNKSGDRIPFLGNASNSRGRRSVRSTMDLLNSANEPHGADNGLPSTASMPQSPSPDMAAQSATTATTSATTTSTTTATTPPTTTPPVPTSASTAAASGSSFPQFSASTAAILERLQGNGGHASRHAALEAKRAEILQKYVTSDKLPTPPPMPTTGRRGRGGRVGTPSGLKTEVGASPTGNSSGRGSGRGRGRGRGRGSGNGRGGGRGRGSKRKRSDSEEESDHDDDDSDMSSSHTPLPTRTKSGRSIHKPVVFVPTIPEPAQGVKRRRSTKTMLAANIL